MSKNEFKFEIRSTKSPSSVAGLLRRTGETTSKFKMLPQPHPATLERKYLLIANVPNKIPSKRKQDLEFGALENWDLFRN
jgi:hypothetical protein